MTLIKWTVAIVGILVIACFSIAYSLPTWVGTDAEPADVASGTGADQCYIYRETAAEAGEITSIEIFGLTAGGGTIDVAVFSKNGNDFTDEEYAEGLTYSTGLNTYNAPGDFTAMPIAVGEYVGFHIAGNGTAERSETGGTGYWYDPGDQIGDDAASTFIENSGTRDTQFRCYNTAVAGAPSAGQVIIIGSIDEDILRYYADTD